MGYFGKLLWLISHYKARVAGEQLALWMSVMSPLGTFTRNRVVERSWPSGAVHLLLAVGMAPGPQAERAWAAWTKTRDFDEVTWQEKRLLAAFSMRIGELDPGSPLVPRINGLTKHMWTAARRTLSQTLAAFDVLTAARIPFIVFKGGALLVEDFATTRRRILSDIDVLVRREAAPDAIKCLTDAGWCSINGESAALLHRLTQAQVRRSGNYRKGQYGEIDLHSTPFHYSRSGEAMDETLWRDAKPATVGTRSVLIPDPTNAIVISLAHAPQSESVEWALDVATRVAHQTIEWDKLAYIARERDLVPSCLAGLRYLRERLSVPIPQPTLDALTKAPVSVAAWMKYWSNISNSHSQNLVQKTAERIADGVLRKRNYSVHIKDRVAVTVARPTLLRCWPIGTRQSIPVSSPHPDYRHQLLVGSGAKGRRLAIRLAVATPPLSRRVFFDVTADGIAVARLRSRLGPPANHEKKITFVLPLPEARETDIAISIEARPVAFVPPHAHAELHIANDPLKFRLVSAWTM
jgi:hypothetical protein